MKCRIIVAAVIEKNGEFLFGKKAAGVGPFPDKWLILGGGVDLEHETLEEGLKREIREEAGIEITNIKHVIFYDGAHEKKGEMVYHIFLNFTADYLSGEVKPGDDIEALQWVKKKDLENFTNTAAVTTAFLKKLGLI